MKKLLPLLLLVVMIKPAFSQLYGNEWINFSQTYFKFQVITNGLYRLNYSTLKNFGVPIDNINGANIQIFNDGKEIPIYVSSTGILGPNDYIEFYGTHNGGYWDSCLYTYPSDQGNSRLSLFNDTAYYFLTWSEQLSNNHITSTVNNIANPPSPELFCWYTSSYVSGTAKNSTNNLSKGDFAYQGLGMYDSDFSPTEGYVDPYFDKTSKDYNIYTPHPYLTGPFANFLLDILGNGITEHYMTLSINGNQIYNGQYSNYTMVHLNFDSINSSTLTAPFTTATFSTAASPSLTDKNTVPWYDFKYPREFDFDNLKSIRFGLQPSATNQYFVAGNFDESGTTPILYDFTNKLRLDAVVENDSVKFLLPSSLQERQLLLIANDTNLFVKVDSLWPVHFVDYSLSTNQGNFIIVSHPYLMIDTLGNNFVEDYRSYKSTINGGSFISIVTNINDLYDQFAYGIKFHPASMNKFAEYIKNKWSAESRYMFLIGKGIEYSVMNDYTWTRPYCFVPTFGSPGSDQLLTALGSSFVPTIPVGRLPALHPQEVSAYLEKIKEYDAAQQSSLQTIANKAWMKNELHLVGGSSQTDQDYFLGFLNGYQQTSEDTLWGTNVHTFAKTSTDPIEEATSDYLDSIISSGTSLITFFGHSSYQSFDFNLDRPANYNNQGKYPLILTNGCLVGNLFTYYHGLADSFLIYPNRGAIAFLGPSIFGVASSLDLYSSNFYKNFCVTDYNKPIGDAIASTFADVKAQSGQPLDIALCEQMLFAGDPSIKLNNFNKPDYDLELQQVSFDPPSVSAGLDSFYLQVVVYNLGKAIDDSIYVDIKRTYPSGEVIDLYHQKIHAPYFNDTLRFMIKTEPEKSLGLNSFYIKVDAGDTLGAFGDVDELSEMNNELGSIPLLIQSDDILPVWPYDYSIVSAQGVTLKASTVNSFAESKQYVFQMDTSQLFNSPLLQTKKITQIGGVVKWTPYFPLTDSVVYYWRTTVDSIYGHPYVWHNFSFIYLEGSSPGWNQSHYYQFLSTIKPSANIELPSTRIFKYPDDKKTISVFNGMTTYVGGPLSADVPAFYENGVYLGGWSCGLGSNCLFAVIDGTTGLFWSNPAGLSNGNIGAYNSTQCKASPRPMFFYNMNSITHNDYLLDFLDTIPDGHYIFFMSCNDAKLWQWDSTMKEGLAKLGLSKYNDITSAVPYSWFLRKNDNSYPVQENVGASFTSYIDTDYVITGKWNQGYIETPLIGPASTWTSLHWKAHEIEAGNDSVTLQLFGIDNNGTETLLANNILASDTLISGINAFEYPYLKMRLNCTDTFYRTPIQLDYWRINYQPVPEAALNPSLFFTLGDTVNEFVPLKLSVALENLTPWSMDSMLMKYVVTDATNASHTFTNRGKPLLGNDTLHITYNFDTGCDCYAGNNFLFVEANPDGDQIEQYHFNNIGLLEYHVIPDQLNPLLNVTFDGVHIIDGDIVSAKPEIEIQLKDENKFVALNDTAAFDIYFIYPDGSHHKVTFDNLKAFFYPADSTNLTKDNTAHALLNEEFLVDGKYQLVVQGYDRGGNASGDNAYHISFEVINKPMISNVLNYPNPFTTSTRFVFTLTGYEVPQQMKITIYTVTGKVVKEIFIGELGNVHIGNNLTDYSFDGTDQYGDRLANGIYFYKIEAMLNGKPMDHYDNGTDNYFKKGIGKMYLMH